MQKVQKWRLDELGMLLNDLATVITAAGHTEWAGVFDHFGQELALIQRGKTLDPAGLKRLVRNIRLCFEGSNGLSERYLRGRDAGETESLNRMLTQLKGRIATALEEIDLRFVEFLN